MENVKGFAGVCRQEFQRLCFNWKIYVGMLIYIIVCYLSQVRIGGHFGVSAYTGMNYITDLSNMNKLLVLTAAFPLATSFCDDWSGKYMNQVVLRSNSGAYIKGKIFMCAVSSFAISFIGLIIYSLFNTVLYGVGTESVQQGEVFYDIGKSTIPFMMIIIRCFLFAIVSSVYAVAGLALSAFIPNRFVAVTAPLFMNTIIEQIMNQLPKTLDLFRIQGGSEAYGGKTAITIVMSLMVVVGYILLAGIAFSWIAKRRIKNEIT